MKNEVQFRRLIWPNSTEASVAAYISFVKWDSIGDLKISLPSVSITVKNVLR